MWDCALAFVAAAALFLGQLVPPVTTSMDTHSSVLQLCAPKEVFQADGGGFAMAREGWRRVVCVCVVVPHATAAPGVRTTRQCGTWHLAK